MIVSPKDLKYIFFILSHSIPQTYEEASQCIVWHMAMKDEIKALEDNKTWYH